MAILQEQFLNGLTIGAFYALIALGYNLIFGVMKVMNLAYGALLTVGAYFALFSLNVLDLSYFSSIIVGILGATIVGVLIDIFIIRPIRSSEWGVIVATLGAGQFIQFAIRRISGGKPEVFPTPFDAAPISLGYGVMVTSLQLLLFGSAGALLAGSLWLLYRTRFGLAVRAVADSANLAASAGIDRNKIALLTFALTSAIAGAVGILFCAFYQTADSAQGSELGLKCLVILIVAGAGNFLGSVAVALILGIAEALISGYGYANHSDLFTYGAMVLLLLLRPHGLFGEVARTRRIA